MSHERTPSAVKLKNLFRTRKEKRKPERHSFRDYAYDPRPRPIAGTAGGRRLAETFDRYAATYARLFEAIAANRGFFAEIPVRPDPARPSVPGWVNGWFPHVDGMILYTLLVEERPATYLEVGSGNSTKFARLAIRHHGLPTRIVSVDPEPRADVDALCDRVIRAPFERVADEVLAEVAPGDVVFMDGSHRTLANSDATVWFTEFLPALPPGTVHGLHDVFLPHDYPGDWMKRLYSEQYVLAAYLLGGHRGDDILFPTYYLSSDAKYAADLAAAYAGTPVEDRKPHGGAFWMRRHG